jgi:predicted unusual protein kinase regulating ubiquinone biosynthesis (AarF/ABC1/UbiB family)
MLNCKQASQLASRAMDEKLSFRESAALKVHLFLCRNCTNFTQQLNFLREASRRSRFNRNFKLTEKAKLRIASTLC